jgi:hypothetical protein
MHRSAPRGPSPISPVMLLQRLRKRLAAEARFIESCLPSPAEKPPSGSNWIDGFRLMAFAAKAVRDLAGSVQSSRRNHRGGNALKGC